MGFICDRVKTYLHISENSFSFDDLDKTGIDFPKMFDWQISFKNFLEKWISGTEYIDIQTSGSTGVPKLIRVSREDMERSARYTLNFLKLNQGMSMLHCLPIEFVAGKMMLVRSLIGQLTCYVVKPSADPLIEVDHTIDFIALTPHQLHSILQNSESKEKLNKIKLVIIGGAALNESDRKELSNMQPSSYLSYGMTETLTHIAMCPLIKEGSLREFKLINDDFGLAVNKKGQLNIKSPYKHAELVETNDVVELTSRDSFILKGRSDNVINSGGIKIHPEEIEALFSQHINTSFFIGSIPSEKLGEEAALYVEDSDISEKNKKVFQDLVKEINIDHRYKPKTVVLIPQFIYTDSGKINRKETIKLA